MQNLWRTLSAVVLAAALTGCVISGSKSSTATAVDDDDDCKSSSVDLGTVIGLVGLAVDGDDKDDYDKFFDDDDDCRCR